MEGGLKQGIYHLCKWLGLFRLSRRLTRRGLRILCYHAFSQHDEHVFRPKLFMRGNTFRRRLEALKRGKYPILALDDAMAKLTSGGLPDCATVITIDDGFPSVYRYAAQSLAVFAFPSTVYLTTYHSVKGTPVFRLLMQYIFWKSTKKEITIPTTLCGVSGHFSLAEPKEKDRVLWNLIRDGENRCSEGERVEIAKDVAQLLDVDLQAVFDDRVFNVMTSDEIRAVYAHGMDVQLHTHRHRFPPDESESLREIADNRAVLEPLVGKPLRHFCYPSGVWCKENWAALNAAGILSATTCEAGLNYANTPFFALKRFLDGEDISQIEFEAELAGFAELLRRMRSRLARSPQQS